MRVRLHLSPSSNTSSLSESLADLNVLLLCEITLDGTPRRPVNVLKHRKKAPSEDQQ